MGAIGKMLQRFQGLIWGNGVQDSAVYFEGHTLYVDVVGRNAGSYALIVRGANPQNVQTELFRVGKDGTITFPSSSQRLTGDLSNSTASLRMLVQSSVTDGATRWGLIPNGSSTVTQHELFNAADPDNAGRFRLFISGVSAGIQAAASGTGSIPTSFAFSAFAGYSFDAYLELAEMSAPTGAADKARIYAVVDGGAKTDLMAIFQSGTAQTIAQEP